MNARVTAWFPLLILVVLAALTFWLNQKVQSPDQSRDGSNRHDADFIVENFSIAQMNKNGEVRYALSANKMVHYPDDDSTYLDQPKLINTENNRAPLTIVSNNALLSRDGDHAYFRGNVHMTRAPYGKSSELNMVTDYLHVIPNLDFAQTDRLVTITEAGNKTRAVGMEFNNQTRIVKLLSKVNSYYAHPQQ